MRRGAYPSKGFRSCSRFRARPDGPRNGKRCCSTTSRKSRARVRFTSGPDSGITFRRTKGREEQAAMLKSFVIAALILQAAATPSFDSGRAWEHLRQLVAIGPRPAGSPAIEQTRTYIKGQLAAAGVAVADQAWDDQTPNGKTHMVNLIAQIPRARKEPRGAS